MTNPYREMCAELLAALEIQLDELRFNNRLCIRARAALAQPEPQSSADGEVAVSLIELRSTVMGLDQMGMHVAAQRVKRAADLLQHQHPQPVAVSERLPEPNDCNDEGYCWWWRTDKAEEWWEFLYLRDAKDHNRRCGSARYTHWLPYYAIPNLPNPND